MKTASTLSWVFPGMGHYYSGRAGKGLLFTGLELLSIGALGSMSSEYALLNDQYQTAHMNMTAASQEGGYINNCEDDDLGVIDCYKYSEAEAARLIEEKNGKRIGMIVSGTAAVGIWLWNTRDIKKSRSSAYLQQDNKFSVGINSYGQVETRIKF